MSRFSIDAINLQMLIIMVIVWRFSAMPYGAPDEDADENDISVKRPLWRAKWEQERPWKPSRMAKKRAWRQKQAAKLAREPQLPGLGRPKTHNERLIDRLAAAPVRNEVIFR